MNIPITINLNVPYTAMGYGKARKERYSDGDPHNSNDSNDSNGLKIEGDTRGSSSQFHRQRKPGRYIYA